MTNPMTKGLFTAGALALAIVSRPTPASPTSAPGPARSADLRWRGDCEETQTGARGAGGR